MAETTEVKVSFKERALGFYYRHEKAIKIGGTVLACVGAFALGKSLSSNKFEALPSGNEEKDSLPEKTEPDFGKDMTMRFYYDDDGTELGNGVGVTEAFAKDFVDYDAEHSTEDNKVIVA